MSELLPLPQFGDLPPLPGPAVPFGVRLQQLRLMRRLSQRKLAALAQVREDTISRLESGRTLLPHDRTLARLAHALGLSVEVFEQAVGMRVVSPPAAPLPCSERALQLAQAFDALPPAHQASLESLCAAWLRATAAEGAHRS